MAVSAETFGVGEVYRIGSDQTNVAVDACAGVPARGGLTAVVHANGENVRLRAEVQVSGQFIAEADVAVGTLAEAESVDPDFAVRHDAVEIDVHAAGRVGLGQREGLSVPADA